MNKMNPEIKARWVAALRSGNYPQGRGHLKMDGCFCCLGVLCDLYAIENGINDWSEEHLSHEVKGIPKAEIGRWAGIWDGVLANPVLTINGEAKMASYHNDCGRTFAEIADAIEAQL